MPRRVLAPYAGFLVVAVAIFLATSPAEAGCNKSVTLYSASWCPYCKQVREILARNDIKYRLLDATTASVQATMRELFGDTSVPRTVIGGVVVEGVDEDRIKTLCRQRQIEHAPLPSMLDIKLPDLPPTRHDGGRQALGPAAPLQAAVAP